MREIPAAKIVESPLMDVIVKALDNDVSFESAVDSMCTLYRDTREVDESVSIIQALYPRLLALRPKIAESAEAEDSDAFKGITRLFAEAGEAWVVMIARLPSEFRGLVEAVLECCARDWEHDAVSLTFVFWYELKQYVTLERYGDARVAFTDVFSKLVDIMVKHLEYPRPEEGETDLFGGDREQEEKFRHYRHSMGDVLKDCCAVIGVTECLSKANALIQQWVSKYASQASDQHVPHWQELEAPLFSLRAMGRMVDPEESTVLSQIIPLIVQIPNQEKVRFQAIMALARYTEWTAQHPETLEAQLNYVISGFQHSSPEVVQAAALAFKFLGTDCQKLLGGHIPQLHSFYESVIDKLKPASQEEVTEGVAAVVAVQPLDKIYETMKLFCDPIMARIMNLANNASDEQGQRAVAGTFDLHFSHIAEAVADQSLCRSLAIDYYLCASCESLCWPERRQPGCQVLRRDPAHYDDDCYEFHFVHSHIGACLPLLAVHDHLVPNRDDPSAAHAGPKHCQRIRGFTGRMFLVGHRCCCARVCGRGRVRRPVDKQCCLPVLRTTGSCFSADPE
jgi:transportin-3